jgi:hypothetical protein
VAIFAVALALGGPLHFSFCNTCISSCNLCFLPYLLSLGLPLYFLLLQHLYYQWQSSFLPRSFHWGCDCNFCHCNTCTTNGNHLFCPEAFIGAVIVFFFVATLVLPVAIFVFALDAFVGVDVVFFFVATLVLPMAIFVFALDAFVGIVDVFFLL